MTQHVLGTINKHIDIGVDKITGDVFIHASSNCIMFTDRELDCLIEVLIIINTTEDVDDAIHHLSLQKIDMWTPAPPPAGVRII